MVNLQLEIARLRRVDELKVIMDENIRRAPDFYKKRMRLLDEFFDEHPAPVDMALILFGAFYDAHHLACHLEGNNLLFYRPKTSHKRIIEKAFLIGEPHPERTLLIYDSDMVTGAAMTETSGYFKREGYDSSKMFGYFDGGCKWRGYKTELMQVDDLLRKEEALCLSPKQ